MPSTPPMPPPVPDTAPASSRHPGQPAFGTVNLILIIGSVLVTFLSSLGEDQTRLLALFISEYPAHSPECLFEVRHGEVWRLFTPMFIHFGIAHLGLNMLGLKNVGDAMEYVHGSRFYLLLTAVLAVASNLGQYFISNSGGFGGMSGVLYGLFGYLWIRGISDPLYPLRLTRQTVVISLVWFAACFSGFMPIANGAHSVGLTLGALWGLAAGRLAVARVASGNARPGILP